MNYLKTFCQFQHVYEEGYQGTASHLTAYYEVAAVVEDSNL